MGQVRRSILSALVMVVCAWSASASPTNDTSHVGASIRVMGITISGNHVTKDRIILREQTWGTVADGHRAGSAADRRGPSRRA